MECSKFEFIELFKSLIVVPICEMKGIFESLHLIKKKHTHIKRLCTIIAKFTVKNSYSVFIVAPGF